MNNAKLYQTSNKLQRADTKSVIKEYASMLRWTGHDTLMDIGCGCGDVTIEILLPELPENFKELTGTDVSAPMIQFAKETYAHLSRVHFETLDIANSLDKHTQFLEYFDHVTSFFCLNWVQDQKKAFQNIFQLLRPRGDCLLTLLAKSPLYDAYERLAEMPKWRKYMKDVNDHISPYHHASDPVELAKNYLYENMFTEYQVEVKDRLYVYPDVDILKSSVKAVNPFVARLMPEDREQFILDYVQTVTDMGLRTEQGTFLTPYKIMVIYAIK